MPMDPDSPFARMGDGSATEGPRIGWEYTGKMKCDSTRGGCGHEWNVPVVKGGAIASGCPKCHATCLVLMDGSVQQAPPPRK